jgi:putative membrane protein
MRTLFSILALVIVAAPSNAQIGNPGFMAPGSADAPQAAAGQTNTTDQLFIRLAAAGGTGEVELAKIAQRKSRNGNVKAFADRMVVDDGTANAALMNLAKQKDIALPKGVQPDQAATKAELDSVNGAEFDLRYMEAQVTDHVKTSQLLVWEIGQGQNADLQHFAADTLPTVLDHLAMARATLMQLRVDALPERQAAVPSRQ